MRRMPTHLVIGGKRLHQMHVNIERLSVAPGLPRRLRRPIRLHQLVVPPMQRIGHVFLDRRVGSVGRLPAPWIAGGKKVFAERVQGETLTVTNLVQNRGRPVTLRNPDPAFVILVPIILENEICSLFRQVSALPIPVPGTVRAGHGIEKPDLHKKGFDRLPG